MISTTISTNLLTNNADSEDEHDPSIPLPLKILWGFRINRGRNECYKKTFLQIYHEAISDDYCSLYVSLMNKDKRKMCMQRFEKHFIPN